MLKAYMHRRERYLAMLNDDRLVRPFAWGSEFLGLNANSADIGESPGEAIKKYAAEAFKNSDEFFHLPEIADFSLQKDLLTWTSAVETPTKENNIARAHFFPARDRRSAVIVLPHWNAREGSYFDLCRVLNRVGLSALRLTLPYHEERRETQDARADMIVSANIGRTLQSVRQAVLDTRAAVRFLKEQGYEKVGIVGTSIGSCIAFLATAHDTGIDAGVYNHVSGYFADVVWRGLSTYHVREGLEDNVTLDELRDYWLPISPLPYLDKLKRAPAPALKFIYTLYDLTFPYDLSLQVREAVIKANIPASFSWLPCGHYTLGEKPWSYLDGFKIVSFLRRHLK